MAQRLQQAVAQTQKTVAAGVEEDAVEEDVVAVAVAVEVVAVEVEVVVAAADDKTQR